MADDGKFHHSWSLPDLYCCFYTCICEGKQHWHLCFPGTTINPKAFERRSCMDFVLTCHGYVLLSLHTSMEPILISATRHVCMTCKHLITTWTYPLPVVCYIYIHLIITWTYPLPGVCYIYIHLIITWTYPLPGMCYKYIHLIITWTYPLPGVCYIYIHLIITWTYPLPGVCYIYIHLITTWTYPLPGVCYK